MSDGDGTDEVYDVAILGSGFGGSMAAHVLVGAGQKVLMIERGDWVERGPKNWEPDSVCEATPCYSAETPYRVIGERESDTIGAYHCVGGPSVFYGAVAFRMRARDFKPDPEIAGDSGAAWPFDYQELEPYYSEAERLLGVSGEAGADPTEPRRSEPYPQAPGQLSSLAARIGAAAISLGLRPFRLPLAINYAATNGQGACVACRTCDCFACAVSAKNDLAARILPRLIRAGLELKTNTVAQRLVASSSGDRVTSVECLERQADGTGRRRVFHARKFIVAAGALASPHLLLASGLDELNPGGRVIGRYLMRHCNAMVFGVFPRKPDPEKGFHKQLGFTDFYFGDPSVSSPRGKLGSLQQVHTPAVRLVEKRAPRVVAPVISNLVEHMTGLLAIAEDQPRFNNGLALDRNTVDKVGLPQLVIRHDYSARDLSARAVLIGHAKRILRRSGAWFSYVHNITTFSHAVGTVRMGVDSESSALDGDCRFRGVDNLYVMDGSCMPTSAAVNPSLTIAAISLRAAHRLTAAD